MNIMRSMAWGYESYDGSQPPPLCFSAPDAVARQSNGKLYTGGGFGVTLRRPKKMMDPSDSSTWQRPYRWDTGQSGLMPGRYPQATGSRYAAP